MSTPTTMYPSRAAFFADEARERSPEVDFGVMWTQDGNWPNWRVSWIERTGELYALCLGGEDRDHVEVFGTIERRANVEEVMRGWADTAAPHELGWVRRRVAGMTTLLERERVFAVADDVEIDSDEDGFHLKVSADGVEHDFRFHGVAFEFANSTGLQGLLEWAEDGRLVRAEVARTPKLTNQCSHDRHRECDHAGCECECHVLAADDTDNPAFGETLAAHADELRKSGG